MPNAHEIIVLGGALLLIAPPGIYRAWQFASTAGGAEKAELDRARPTIV